MKFTDKELTREASTNRYAKSDTGDPGGNPLRSRCDVSTRATERYGARIKSAVSIRQRCAT